MSKHLLVTAILVILFIAKVVFFTPLLHDALIFDEIYYVTSAKYIFYKLDLTPEFRPPYESRITYSNNTIFANVTLYSSLVYINVLWETRDWLNLEHPIFAKLLLGVLIALLRSLVLVRLVLLTTSSIVLGLFIYTLIRRYGVRILAGFFAVLLGDWVYVHFMYLAVLDTFMLMFLLLSISMLFRKRYALSIIFLSLACASKEIAIIATVPYAVYFTVLGNKKFLIASLLCPVLALLFSYTFYLVFVEPWDLIAGIQGLAGIVDPFVYRRLWILGLEARWGMFRLFTPFVWIWFLGLVLIAVRRNRSMDPLDAFPYFFFFSYFLVIIILVFKRSIYPYYYAPAVILAVYPMKDVLISLYSILRGKNICLKHLNPRP